MTQRAASRRSFGRDPPITLIADLALAERLGLDVIATLDRRHFTVVRPKHVRVFEILP